MLHRPGFEADQQRTVDDESLGDRVDVELIALAGPHRNAIHDVDEAARATERFWRADASRSRAAGGSGLGLAIVDSIMAAHGGSTTVDSVAGEGTTVRLTFQTAPAQITGP